MSRPERLPNLFTQINHVERIKNKQRQSVSWSLTNFSHTTSRYVPPPPSRPKLNNPDDDRQRQLQQEQLQQQNQHRNQLQQNPTVASPTAASPAVSTTTLAPTYGTIVHHPNQIQDVNKSVSSLAVQYVPNYGNQYVAVVPPYQKVDYLNDNNVYDNTGKYAKYDKYNDKYLAKLRKFKAYEQQKVKYVPYYQPVSEICFKI